MNNLGYLFAANVFVWGGIFYYLFKLKRLNESLKKDIELLKEVIDKEGQK